MNTKSKVTISEASMFTDSMNSCIEFLSRNNADSKHLIHGLVDNLKSEMINKSAAFLSSDDKVALLYWKPKKSSRPITFQVYFSVERGIDRVDYTYWYLLGSGQDLEHELKKENVNDVRAMKRAREGN